MLKYLAVVFFVFLALFQSCNKQPHARTTRRFLTGQWVRKDYIEYLVKTKSPWIASQFASPIAILNFKNNSDTVLPIYNLHDGGQSVLKIDAKGKTVLCSAYNGYPEFTMVFDTSNMILTLEDSANNSIPFIHWISKSTFPDSLINSIIFTTSFFKAGYPDSIVEFLVDGKIKGLEPFSKYQVQYDFVECKNSDYLHLWESGATDCQNYFWKWNNDTLELATSQIDSIGNCFSGSIAYKLVKNTKE